MTRYYSSTQGRFVSSDTFSGIITNPQTVNRYAYVTNNPLRYVDPTGQFQKKPECDQVCQESRKAAERARKQAKAEGTPVTTITKNQKKDEPVSANPQEVFETNTEELNRMRDHGDVTRETERFSVQTSASLINDTVAKSPCFGYQHTIKPNLTCR